MSKQKRGVQYVQQDEPAFLKRMKLQAGYKEGPTIDTKRSQLPESNSDSEDDTDDEKPQVVVLKPGDLTEAQAKHAEQEAACKPREATNEKILFKKPTKTNENSDKETKKDKKSSGTKIKNKSLLSFAEEDDEYS
ncbi:uncharacterized protein KIAA1143 homolog isoform X2 [Watersipora subatra]